MSTTEVNKQLTGFCMRYLGRPSHYFLNRDGISEEDWEGSGFYLLRLEQDGVDFLGETFEDAWRAAQLRRVELEAVTREREHQIKEAERRRRTDELVGRAERGLGIARRLFTGLDDLVDEGLRRVRTVVDGVEVARELFRPEPREEPEPDIDRRD